MTTDQLRQHADRREGVRRGGMSMVDCKNCGLPVLPEGRPATLLVCQITTNTGTISCERRAKERALAEVARLRATIERVREACEPGSHTPLCCEWTAQAGDGCICSRESDNELRAEIAALLGEP